MLKIYIDLNGFQFKRDKEIFMDSDIIRKDFPQGYYTLTWKDSDPREPEYVDLYCPDGSPLNVAFDADACFNDIRIVEGIQRKITRR